ncbi:MAG: tetratricopeptide repeat protein [Planctomycetota bacterium]|jgi:tetratricopeptide (TPR) repeat protein
MGEESKIIEFPDNRREVTTSSDNGGDEPDEFEAWEPLVKFREKDDYAGLVEYCKRRAERFPEDPYAQFYLGEAYVLNGEYEKAIEFLSNYHKKQPWNIDFQHVILDALFALGKNENDFNWIKKPIVLRMSDDILDACYHFLKPKKKSRSALEIHTNLVTKGYLLFTEDDLFKALTEDDRFIVEDVGRGAFFAQVRAARKKST